MRTEICYSHADCTTFEVKRKTKSACVSKTSMPSFNSGPRRKKPRKINAEKSKSVVPQRNTRKKAAVRPSKNQRVGKVISGAPFLVSYLDIKNDRSSPKVKSSPQTCRRLCSTSRNLLDASTQTVNVSSEKSIYTGPKANYLLGAENDGELNGFLQGWLKDASPLKVVHNNDGAFCTSKVSSQKRGSGDTTGRRNSVETDKLDVCCFPLININPYPFENELTNGRYSIGDSKAYSEKGEPLENEKDSLIGYIYQAQDKVNGIRTRLVKLRHTLTSQTTIPISPRDSKQARQLKKALDSIIKEVDVVSEMGKNWSTLSDASPCRSPVSGHSPKVGRSPIIMCGEMYDNCAGDAAEKSYLDHTPIEYKSYSETPKRMSRSPKSTSTHKVHPELHRKDRSPRSPSVESLSSSVGKESSLTLLKKELGSFFKKMKLETDLLMKDAQMHHDALLHYSGRDSMNSSLILSSDSTGL